MTFSAVSGVGSSMKRFSSATSSPCSSAGTASHQRVIGERALVGGHVVDLGRRCTFGGVALLLPSEVAGGLGPGVGAVDRDPVLERGHHVRLLVAPADEHDRAAFDDHAEDGSSGFDVRHDEGAEVLARLHAGASTRPIAQSPIRYIAPLPRAKSGTSWLDADRRTSPWRTCPPRSRRRCCTAVAVIGDRPVVEPVIGLRVGADHQFLEPDEAAPAVLVGGVERGDAGRLQLLGGGHQFVPGLSAARCRPWRTAPCCRARSSATGAAARRRRGRRPIEVAEARRRSRRSRSSRPRSSRFATAPVSTSSRKRRRSTR